MSQDRFRPTRAGVINVWDYVDEEFAFADGRLALRGHNGSGKTKALEVLFPFVLDGMADARRLDPFSGENRTMKSNLLYRGQEAEYGYVWMEFARTGQPETVTLVIGMRAHRNRDGVKTSFFVTGKRLGLEFGLLSADSRPLTERQLKAVLEPGAWQRTATEYRDAIDARLFGLGRERYAQLLDLLLALRRPLLAKDLDPAKVSDTLSSGLSPVDDDLVAQAARDFENLAAVQKLFDDLVAAQAAVQEFLTHYTSYLRSHARAQLDRVLARIDAAAGHANRIAAAAAEHSRALAAERHAEAERDARRAEAGHLAGRLAGLKNSDEYKAQGRLDDKRREVSAGARDIEDGCRRLRRDHQQIREMENAASKLLRRAAEARTAAGKRAAELADAAQRSGIAADGSGLVDTGDDLLTTAKARAVARHDDVAEIRRPGAGDRQDAMARDEHDKATAAAADLRSQQQALAETVGQLYEQAREFGPYAQAELRPLLGVSDAAPWPPDSGWPEPAAASVGIVGLLTGPAPDAEAAIRGTFPAAAVQILNAFHTVTEGTLKNAQDRVSTALRDFTEALAACDEDYRVDWVPGGVVTVHVLDDEGRKPVAEFAARIADRKADQGILLEDRERKVLEDELLAGLAQQIHTRVIAARDLVHDMDSDTRSKPMSSGIAVGIRWAQSDRITDRQRAASRLLERAVPGPERLAELRGLLREMIREYRGSHPRATYREALSSVLDYRSWHVFELLLLQPGEPEVRLTRARHSVMSGGEKSASIHLPLFAAANALYSSAKDHCPRMIALDEAFVGIDERYKPDLFGLAVKFDLDLFMTGHDLWVTCATVPMIAHYDMYHDKTTHTVSSLLMLWDGTQLLDAAVGYADNDELVTRLLGFRPTRHAPLGSEETLYAAVVGDQAEDDEDEDDAGSAGYAGVASDG